MTRVVKKPDIFSRRTDPKAALLVQDSFQTLKKWVKELKEHGPEDIVVAIAGNKNDLGDIRWAKTSFL